MIINKRPDCDLRCLNRRLKYDVWCFRQCVVVGHFRLENDFIDGLFDYVRGLELVDDHHRYFLGIFALISLKISFFHCCVICA
jgi:hypothetical protein